MHVDNDAGDILRFYFDWRVRCDPSQAALWQGTCVRLAYYCYGLNLFTKASGQDLAHG